MRPNRQLKAKPCRTNKTATASTPEGELHKHLKDLGLETVETYRTWCKANGFSANANKDWQERRQEKQTAERLAAQQAAKDALLPHLAALGLPDLAAYELWCRERNFPTGLNKSKTQLEQEARRARGEQAEVAMTQARRPQRRPEETIAAFHAGMLAPHEVKTPFLQKIGEAFVRLHEPGVRDAFLALLLHLHSQTKLLSAEPVIPHLGAQTGNTYIEALAELSRHHIGWQRSPQSWRPDSHNARRQFGTLARHLLAHYSVPAFLDAAWFRGNGAEARRQQVWFRHIGRGQNIRTADLPIALTKRAAHLFLQAPADMSVEHALRWAQVRSLGGDDYLARAILNSRLGETFENEEFWLTVLHFFVNNPMLDADLIGPVIDFIHDRKFVVQEIVVDGEVTQGIPEPNFEMKGRTVPALQQRVDAWHLHLAKMAKRPIREWEPCGLEGYTEMRRDPVTKLKQRWTIRELVTGAQLQEEGKALHHCVASYAPACARGTTSIWSLQVQYLNGQVARRVMTIEVNNQRKMVVQARGNCNKSPGAKHTSFALREAPDILKAWAAQEQLTLQKHLW